MHGGQRWTVQGLTRRILEVKDGLEGLTISGGEPLYQHRALARILAEVRAQTGLSVLVFTGYSWDELRRLKGIEQFLSHVDVLLAGRYMAERRVAQGLIGSANKTAHFLTSRYTPGDLEGVPQAEVILSPDGKITFSGIDPLTW
jgi:anaerobic ribonucleoside-triphosphate reductase activating protein